MTTTQTLSRDAVRRIDQIAIERLGLPGLVLMENAGAGAADLLLRQSPQGTISICTGGGNNGGDGFVIARHLAIAGCDVQVLELADRDRLTSDARQNADVAERLGISIEQIDPATHLNLLEQRLQAADWIVDALLGTGLTSEVREPFRGVIEAINRASAGILAVDLPSGLDCDRGVPLGVAVRATVTATFVAMKQGFHRPGADAWTGAVEVIGIGVPADLETRLRP